MCQTIPDTVGAGAGIWLGTVTKCWRAGMYCIWNITHVFGLPVQQRAGVCPPFNDGGFAWT